MSLGISIFKSGFIIMSQENNNQNEKHDEYRYEPSSQYSWAGSSQADNVTSTQYDDLQNSSPPKWFTQLSSYVADNVTSSQNDYTQNSQNLSASNDWSSQHNSPQYSGNNTQNNSQEDSFWASSQQNGIIFFIFLLLIYFKFFELFFFLSLGYEMFSGIQQRNNIYLDSSHSFNQQNSQHFGDTFDEQFRFSQLASSQQNNTQSSDKTLDGSNKD